MKYSPDAYLLYETNRLVTFSLRIKVQMKETVDASSLKTAAEKAFGRYPYYHKQISIDADGGIDLIPNPRPIAVNPVSKTRPTLFSPESNYHPCSVEYEGTNIFFNMYHGMCGGCGTFAWVKTTVYEYICTRYGVRPDPGTTILADSPVEEGEFAHPGLEDLPDEMPVHQIRQDKVWIAGLEYLLGFGSMLYQDIGYHEMEIPKAELMRYASSNDGSPLAVMGAVMFKTLSRLYPKNKLPFRGKSNHNCREELGCPKSHQDLLSDLYYLLPGNVREWPLDRICTAIRGATILQFQPEYAWEKFRRFYAFTAGVDNASGMKEKKKYASKHSIRVPKTQTSFNINYTGREDWGGMLEYVDRVYVITDAHLLIEIADVGDVFCVSMMQMGNKKAYMDTFLQILAEENIPCTYLGKYNRHLAVSEVKNAPVITG